MTSFERILFPVDFSERCEIAAHSVHSLAAAARAEVVLFHALDDSASAGRGAEFGLYGWEEFRQERRQAAERQLRDFMPSRFPDGQAKRVVCEGEPGRSIVAHARALDASLIMMPSHGLGPFRRFLIGSVTAKVLHDAPCPVWTGEHIETRAGRPEPDWKRIVCAVDLGPRSDAALRWAADLAALFGGEVTIVHAVPVVEARPAKYLNAELEAVLAAQAAGEIAAMKQRTGVVATEQIRGGRPEKVVREAALDRQAGLVVMARSAEGLRGHTYSIIRTSPCPVVSV